MPANPSGADALHKEAAELMLSIIEMRKTNGGYTLHCKPCGVNTLEIGGSAGNTNTACVEHITLCHLGAFLQWGSQLLGISQADLNSSREELAELLRMAIKPAFMANKSVSAEMVCVPNNKVPIQWSQHPFYAGNNLHKRAADLLMTIIEMRWMSKFNFSLHCKLCGVNTLPQGKAKKGKKVYVIITPRNRSLYYYYFYKLDL